jgi:hypothetical protein
MGAGLEAADIKTLFARDLPSMAFAAIEERLAAFPAGDRPRFRRQVIEALEALFPRGQALTADWLGAILAGSPNYLAANDEARLLAATPSNQERLCALLGGGLEACPPSERGARVELAAADLADVSLLCALFRSVEADWTAERAARAAEEAFFGARMGALRNGLLARVSDLAKSGGLWAQAAPSALLWFWFACGQEQEVYIFTQRSMRAAGSLRPLLDVAIDRVPADDGDHDVIAVRRWSKIIDFNGLEKRAVELVMSGAGKAERDSARRFLTAYANGKSDLFK